MGEDPTAKEGISNTVDFDEDDYTIVDEAASQSTAPTAVDSTHNIEDSAVEKIEPEAHESDEFAELPDKSSAGGALPGSSHEIPSTPRAPEGLSLEELNAYYSVTPPTEKAIHVALLNPNPVENPNPIHFCGSQAAVDAVWALHDLQEGETLAAEHLAVLACAAPPVLRAAEIEVDFGIPDRLVTACRGKAESLNINHQRHLVPEAMVDEGPVSYVGAVVARQEVMRTIIFLRSGRFPGPRRLQAAARCLQALQPNAGLHMHHRAVLACGTPEALRQVEISLGYPLPIEYIDAARKLADSLQVGYVWELHGGKEADGGPDSFIGSFCQRLALLRSQASTREGVSSMEQHHIKLQLAYWSQKLQTDDALVDQAVHHGQPLGSHDLGICLVPKGREVNRTRGRQPNPELERLKPTPPRASLAFGEPSPVPGIELPPQVPHPVLPVTMTEGDMEARRELYQHIKRCVASSTTQLQSPVDGSTLLN